MRWALVNKSTNIVENIIIWDGVCNAFSLEKYLPVQLNENERCDPESLYDENADPRFTA